MTSKDSLDEALRIVASTPQGQMVLREVLAKAGIYRQPFNGDAAQTAFRCGELNVGQWLTGWLLEVTPQAFVNMHKEQEDERDSGNASAGDPGPGDTSGSRAGDRDGAGEDSGNDSLIEQYPLPGGEAG